MPRLAPLPKMSGIPKLITPSSIAPGSRGPGRVKTEPVQPTYEDFISSWFKRTFSEATYPEFLADFGLKKRGMKFGEDYQYQRDLGTLVEGGLGARIDFVVINRRPYLGLPVQGLRFHPVHGPKGQYDMDQFTRIVQRLGWDLIPLDEDDLLNDAAYTVRLAVVLGIDISRYRGRV